MDWKVAKELGYLNRVVPLYKLQRVIKQPAVRVSGRCTWILDRQVGASTGLLESSDGAVRGDVEIVGAAVNLRYVTLEPSLPFPSRNVLDPGSSSMCLECRS